MQVFPACCTPPLRGTRASGLNATHQNFFFPQGLVPRPIYTMHTRQQASPSPLIRFLPLLKGYVPLRPDSHPQPRLRTTATFFAVIPLASPPSPLLGRKRNQPLLSRLPKRRFPGSAQVRAGPCPPPLNRGSPSEQIVGQRLFLPGTQQAPSDL